MEISNKTKRIYKLLWLLVVPIGMFLVYQFFPSNPIQWGNYLLLLILAAGITYFPFFISGTPIMLVQFVNLAVFLKYGVFAEIILMQVCLIPVFYNMNFGKETLSRMAFSSFMFFVASVMSGFVVHLLGFQVGSINIKDIFVYGLLFAVLTTFMNHHILYIRDYLIGQKHRYIDKESLWDFAGLTMTFPFGISLYMLEYYIGFIAILLLGIPFLLITFLVRLYSDSEKVNTDLTRASEFGHELAERMSSREIVDMFIDRVSNMFPMDSAYIVDYINDQFVVLRAIEDGIKKDLYFSHEDIKFSLVGKVYEEGKPMLFKKQVEWIQRRPPFLSLDVQSVMSVPIYRNKKIEAVLVLASKKRSAFERYQLNIVHLLCSYFAVTIERARFVKEALAKSERCELTQLYNYRYLDKRVEKDMENIGIGKSRTLSLIMLDIDRFKMVNDTFGHHSGNLILRAFAKILKEEIGSNGTVSRYGGEEFVVLLPNYTKIEAIHIAEQIRRRIEQTPFVVQLDLAEETREEEIFITVSSGVSTAPEDSDEGKTLLRNADRALYIGAKQAGRNKVAEYIK